MDKKAFFTILAIALVSFLCTSDMSIVNTALPQMSTELAIPMNQAEWISSSYLIIICMSLILFGKLGDQLDKIKIFQMGTWIFTISSLLCGISTNFWLLVVARGLQGIGAAMTMATNFGIITETVPFSAQGRGLGLNTTVGQTGYIAGPAVAGLILSIASWHWIFLFNVPIGIAAFVFGMWVYPHHTNSVVKVHIDYFGFINLALLLGLFFGGIFYGQETSFTHPLVVGMFIFSGILLVSFISWEKHVNDPILELSLFKNVGFSISIIAMMLMFIIVYLNNVLLPFYIQDTLGFSPSQLGLIMSILPMVNVFTAYFGGVLCDKYGAIFMSRRATVLFIIAEVIFAIMRPAWSLFALIPGFIIFAFANGFFQNNPMVMEHADKQHQGIAGSIAALSRNIGFAVGLSLATSVLYAGMSLKAGKKVTSYPFGHPDWFVSGMHLTYTLGAFIMVGMFIMLSWLKKHSRQG